MKRNPWPRDARGGPRPLPPGRSDAMTRGPRDRDQDLVRVAGLPAVTALFEMGAERIERLFYLPELQAAAQPIAALLGRARKPFGSVGGEELARIAGGPMHGGIVALARSKPVPLLDFSLISGWARHERLILVLDGVSNPHNFGAIARTAAFFGVNHIVVSNHPSQAMPSGAAYRIAEGGLDYLELVRTTRLPAMLTALKPHFRVVATSLTPEARPLEQVARDRPVALLLGNEEHGLEPATLAACDVVAKIPGGGRVQSLNVSAATAIAIHWFSAPISDLPGTRPGPARPFRTPSSRG